MATSRDAGLVLLSGTAASAAEWVRGGVVPCHVAEHSGQTPWALVTPAVAGTAAQEPYDEALTLLAARHVGPRLAPTIGLFVLDGAAVLTAQGGGWRAVRRWALRDEQRRVVRGPDLPPLRPSDLHRVLATSAGARAGELVHVSEVERLWGRTDLTAREWVVEVTRVLRLPGGRVLDGTDAHPGPRVDPDARAVASFESVVKDVHG